MLWTISLWRTAIVHEVAAYVVSASPRRHGGCGRVRRYWGVSAACEDSGTGAAVHGLARRREGDLVNNLIPRQRAGAMLRSVSLWSTAVASDVAADVVTAVISDQGTASSRRSGRVASGDAQPHLEPAQADWVVTAAVDTYIAYLRSCLDAHGRPRGVGTLCGASHRFHKAVCEQVCGGSVTVGSAAECRLLTRCRGQFRWWPWWRWGQRWIGW